MLNVQQFIKEKGVDALTTELGIKVTKHGKYPNLIGLKYSQIESPKAHPVVVECRGIILDTANGYSVVCRGMDRFFNYGEEAAANLDLESTKVTRKEDGSLLLLYCYNNRWQVATSGSPDASGQVGSWGLTFSELFWKVFQELDYTLPQNTEATYYFELMTPQNRIVVDNGKDNKLVYLGMRYNNTGDEYSSVPLSNNWQAVTWTHLDCGLDTLKTVLDAQNGLEGEGVVLRDKYFNRVKMKCADYVRLHHAVSALSPRNILDVVRNGEGAEFLASFDNYRDFVAELTFGLNGLVEKVTAQYFECKSTSADKKSFALKAVKTKCPAALFAMYDGKARSAKDYFANCNIDLLMSLLKVDSSQ